MRSPKRGDKIMTSGGEGMIKGLSEAGLATVVVNGLKIDFYPDELEWSEEIACWQQRSLSGFLPRALPLPNGRPPLSREEPSLRVGFAITKKQYLVIASRSRMDGCSFSETVRRALDLYLRDP